MDGLVETEFLIVGAGPAGASLACFLTMYGKLTEFASQEPVLADKYYRLGLKGIIISNNPGTADSPRAHITNQATMGTYRPWPKLPCRSPYLPHLEQNVFETLGSKRR